MDEKQDKLLNLHQILQKTQIENFKEDEEETAEPYTYRAKPTVYALASQICERHGIKTATFVRKCLEQLVSEYVE